MSPETVLTFLWMVFREPLLWTVALCVGFYMVIALVNTIENTLRD